MSDEQGAHAALIKRLSDHFAVQAGKTVGTHEGVQLDQLDVGGLFLSTGIAVLLQALTAEGVASYLRDMARGLEAGNPTRN